MNVMIGHRGSALTLAEAAHRIGKTPQRVSQLLKQGRLSGPEMSDGRAPKNVGRVWSYSVEEYKSAAPRRQGLKVDAAAVSDLEGRVQALEALVSDLRVPGAAERALVERERAARSAAIEIKVAADAANNALQIERSRKIELEKELAALHGTVNAANDRAAIAEQMSAAYGDSLTQLLAPDNVNDF